MVPLKVGSLFSGIGGFDLGFERAGMQTEWFCEQDPFCQRVLAKHWPGVPCYDDVREIGAHNVKPVDILCGGFPCQDISLAGKGAGLTGARSGLWSEFARLVGELRPRYVVVENVPALRKRGLDQVLEDLNACGYDAEWDGLSAATFGAPHRRDRIWIVAYPYSDDGGSRRSRRSSASRARQSESEWSFQDDPNTDGRRLKERTKLNSQAKQDSTDGNPRGRHADGFRHQVADACSTGLERHRSASGDASQESDTECSTWWSVEPDVGRVVARLSPWVDGGGVDGPALSDGTREVLRALQSEDAAQALRWTARGHGGIQAAQILLAELCEQTRPTYALGDISLACEEASQAVVRSVWVDGAAACSPCRRATGEQRTEQYPDALHLLSRLLACDCGAARLDPTGTPTAAANWVDRLRALGNALVPQIAQVIGERIVAYEEANAA